MVSPSSRQKVRRAEVVAVYARRVEAEEAEFERLVNVGWPIPRRPSDFSAPDTVWNAFLAAGALCGGLLGLSGIDRPQRQDGFWGSAVGHFEIPLPRCCRGAINTPIGCQQPNICRDTATSAIWKVT